MEIKTPKLTKQVTEYSFIFNAGMELSFIVDKSAGDDIEDVGDEYWITLAAKPNQFDPDEIIPEERIVVYKNQLAVSHVKERTQTLPSADDIFEMNKLMHKLPKTVQ